MNLHPIRRRQSKDKVFPGGALDHLFDAHANLWGDLSAGSGANALARDREFGRGFLVRRADRLLFGTDYLKPGQDVPQFELLASFDLPDERSGPRSNGGMHAGS